MSNCLTKCIYTWVLGSGGPLWAGPANRAAARLLEENRKRYPWTATWPSLIILIEPTLVQDWKAANGYAVYRLDMIGDGCLKWGIQMYMMYTLIHDDSYGMLQHGLNLQPNFPVWSIGILFMTWSCPSRTSWSKGTKIQFAQASGIWSEYSEWPPWNGNCYICYRMPGKPK